MNLHNLRMQQKKKKKFGEKIKKFKQLYQK